MSLQKLMQQIKAIRPFAEEEVSEMPRETLGGRISRQRQAVNNMKTLSESYRQELLRTAVFILVIGEKREEFLKSAVEQFDFFSADHDGFYRDLARRVSPTVYKGRTNDNNTLDILMRHFEDKALDLGMIGYPLVAFKHSYQRNIVDENDFVSLTKQIVNEQIGAEVVGLQAAKDILDSAMNKGHEGKTTPILISVETADLQDTITGLSRLTSKVYVIGAELSTDALEGSLIVPEVNKQTVKQTIAALRSLMQGKSVPSLIILAEPTANATLSQETLLNAKKLLNEPTESDIEEAALQSVANFGAAETLMFPDEESFVAAAKDIEAKTKTTRKPRTKKQTETT